MTRIRFSLLTSVALMGLALDTQPAHGQIGPVAQTALANSRAGAVRARLPGLMVNRGVARALTFSDFVRSTVEITETEPEPSARRQLLIEAIDTVFEELQEVMLEIGFIWAQRAAITPGSSSDAGSGDASTDGGSETVTDSGTDTDTSTGGRRKATRYR